MIKINDPASSEARAKTIPLSLEQEEATVKIINCLIGKEILPFPEDACKLLQDFVNHYQNMAHYVAYTSGLWATDKPDKVIDESKILFRLSLK